MECPEHVVGIDGCRGGWVLAHLGDRATGSVDVEVVEDLAPVFALVADGRVAAIGIDMPIGLPEAGRRRADTEARHILGARRSSLFPTPVSGALVATSHDDANRRSRAIDGRGISRQAFNLFPRIREVRSALSPALQPRVSEVHPETSFALMNGAPMRHPKRLPDGFGERVAALEASLGPGLDVVEIVDRPRRGARRDDILDALAAAWTARRIALGTARLLGDPAALDAAGFTLTIAV